MNFAPLRKELEGELLTDETTRRLYATDASAYREIPAAVAIPANEKDIQRLIRFAIAEKTSLIPRTAGTSLAGQVVGGGIVVDVSRHFNRIIEVNTAEKWAIVEPGIVRDDFNNTLRKHGLFFAPETSTANRAMIGGMIGNNSCGSNSVVYGSTREHLIEVTALMADGTKISIGPLDNNSFQSKLSLDSIEGNVYRNIHETLSNTSVVEEIFNQFPKPGVARRNTGYAIDMLARMQPFNAAGNPFNFCSLIAGSEGTLAFVLTARIKLTPIDPPHKKLVCIHCESIDESLKANLVVLRHSPSAVELMDHYVFEATKRNIGQQENRFFIEGDPKAILVAELIRENETQLQEAVDGLIGDLKAHGFGYSYPVVAGADIKKVWDLRKAGLGLLSNVPGDVKPVPVIEDTAVDVHDLPAYISEIGELLKQHGLYSVHYAHAGSGEIHLRPYIDLKKSSGVKLFRDIASGTASLVKKYNGSLSGEHGDGRLRGEFIPQMIGEKNYAIIKELKRVWDPNGIFNPGKIVDTPPMDSHLRFGRDQVTKEFDTMLDFSDTMGILRTAEQCNGSGDCRKTEITGGTMCPSYMATRKEHDTTRARANILREMITHSEKPNPFAHDAIKEVMDLCLGCKGCKSECPSNVDLAKLKQEWQYQYYKEKGIPLRSRLIGNFSAGMKLASLMPWAYRTAFNSHSTISKTFKKALGFAAKRSMPGLSRITWRQWMTKEFKAQSAPGRLVYMFVDELLNYNEADIGIVAVKLLHRLGYEVRFKPHVDSGRSLLSKGMLDDALKLARKNVSIFKDLVNEKVPLIGVEPSAILTFRDEYPDLLRGDEKRAARDVATNTFLIEEFLSKEMDAGRIDLSLFTNQHKIVKLHGHCQQKALSSLTPVKKILTHMGNNEVHLIPSGCCGMAGSFGYEQEHFELSMQIGELVLFPVVRQQGEEVVIAATGTSCRHQIKDGTERKALHPVEILWAALK
jgi:FAD/FMN-containing dehydrogenase/Fe-S oxidoreductase